jgi:hypothetical protein
LQNNDSTDDAEPEIKGSILWGSGGISILPHGNFPLLEVVTRVLLQRKDYERLIAILMQQLDREENQKVWSSLLTFFRYIQPQDKTRLTEFYKRLFEKYPGLSTTREAAIFLAYVHWTAPEFVRSVLSRWKDNDAPLVQQAYGELITLIRLSRQDLEWPVPPVDQMLKEGSSHARTGLAYAAAHVWAETDDNDDLASTLMEQVLVVGDDKAWSAAFDLFRIVDEVTPSTAWVRVLKTIANQISTRPPVNSTFVIQRLQTLLPHQAMLVAEIATALVEKWREGLRDLRTSTAAVAPELVDIAITIHRLGPDTREPGIKLFEGLLDVDAYAARETLNQIDNRFRSAAPVHRRRLPRRNRAPRRARRAS